MGKQLHSKRRPPLGAALFQAFEFTMLRSLMPMGRAIRYPSIIDNPKSESSQENVDFSDWHYDCPFRVVLSTSRRKRNGLANGPDVVPLLGNEGRRKGFRVDCPLTSTPRASQTRPRSVSSPPIPLPSHTSIPDPFPPQRSPFSCSPSPKLSLRAV